MDVEFLKAQTERLEALGAILQYRGKRTDGGIMIRGQAFTIRTLHDLVLMVVRLRYEKGLNDKARERILQTARLMGLWTPQVNRQRNILR